MFKKNNIFKNVWLVIEFNVKDTKIKNIKKFNVASGCVTQSIKLMTVKQIAILKEEYLV